MIDLVTIGETMVSFLPKEQGALRYVQSFGKKTAGAESNVAIGAAKLGHSTGWISKLGNDEFGEFILREVRGEGVDASRVARTDTQATGIMFKQNNAIGETSVIYYRQNSAASTLEPKDVDADYIQNARIVHITGVTPALSDSCAKTVRHVVQIAKEAGVMVSFDPNIRLKLWSVEKAKETLLPLLQQSDIVLLGLDEGEILLGSDQPKEIIRRLRETGVRKIAVKMGAKGAVVADETSVHCIPIVEMDVVDNIGAGDAFNAGFLCGILEDRPIQDCGKMGALMGGFAVSAYGDIEGLPFRDQFDRLLCKGKQVYR